MNSDAQKFSHVLDHYFKGKPIRVYPNVTMDIVVDLGFRIEVVKKFSLTGVLTPFEFQEATVDFLNKHFFIDGEPQSLLIRTRQGEAGIYYADIFTEDDEHLNLMVMQLHRQMRRVSA